MLLFSLSHVFIFHSIFSAKELIISYGVHPFDICSKNPELWKGLKLTYLFCFLFSYLVLAHSIYTRILMKFSFFSCKTTNVSQKNDIFIPQKDDLSLLIGLDSLGKQIYLPETGLYQNFLITGTIGAGKTSSAMYPFTNQLMHFNFLHPDKKIGMLILDVKGNYYQQVKKYAMSYQLEKDLIVIALKSQIFYNTLHKPHLKPHILANRLKSILLLFSENNSESYWLDKAEEILTECIKLCRLYNDNYVTFLEIHKLVTDSNYYKEKITILKNLFILGKLSDSQIYELNTSLNFFQKEFTIILSNETRGYYIWNIYLKQTPPSAIACARSATRPA